MASTDRIPYDTRYCAAQDTAFASGDQLLYLLDDGWHIIHINQEIHLVRGRRVRVFIFALYRNRAVIEVSVVATPFVVRYAMNFVEAAHPALALYTGAAVVSTA